MAAGVDECVDKTLRLASRDVAQTPLTVRT